MFSKGYSFNVQMVTRVGPTVCYTGSSDVYIMLFSTQMIPGVELVLCQTYKCLYNAINNRYEENSNPTT
jgi:hypothetical protein